MLRPVLMCISLIVLTRPAVAEVTTVSQTGFSISHTVMVETDAETAWAALLSPDKWWNKDHSWSGDASNFFLEPVPGGCFCEVWNGGEVQHMAVASIINAQSLTLRGALGPLQSQGVIGGMVWALDENEDDGITTITVSYTVGGYLPEGMDYWAGPVDGVIVEQANRLAAYLNTGSPGTE